MKTINILMRILIVVIVFVVVKLSKKQKVWFSRMRIMTVE